MRALLLALLANGRSRIHNVLFSPDTYKLIDAAKSLGADVSVQGDTVVIDGVGRELKAVEFLDIGNSGILRRFLTGILSTQHHRYKVVGDASVMARPMKSLNDALMNCGVRFYEDGSFQGPFQPGYARVDGQDSQLVSSLLFTAACTPGITEIEVNFPGEKPWIDMTLHWLRFLGVPFEHDSYRYYKVTGKEWDGFDYTVPGDFSTAAFPYVGGIITQGLVEFEGLQHDPSQGDRLFLEMNLLEGGEFSLNSCIDAVPIAAVQACFAKDFVVLTDIGVARTKECDRLHVITSELNKMGAQVYAMDDALLIKPSTLRGAEVDSHGDHRIAMALTVAGCAAEGVTVVSSIECIQKTYPGFIDSFVGLGAVIS